MKLYYHLTWCLALFAGHHSLAFGSEPIETTLDHEGFVSSYYEPSAAGRSVGVLVLGGSEGGKPTPLARQFAAAGYPVLSLAYFKAEGLPDALDEIPLEYFDKPLEWFAARPQMQGKPIVAAGGSKGAELALLLASRNKAIAGVIAISPSSVVFQGIPKVFFPPRSSWTCEQKPLPFVAYDVSQGVDPKNLRALYVQSLKQEKQVADAAIPVENIAGPILLLSGTEDTMWPAPQMADAIVTRLQSHEFSHDYEHVEYQDAGHTLNEFFMLGGTKDGNRQARLDSWGRISEFLSEGFPPDEEGPR